MNIWWSRMGSTRTRATCVNGSEPVSRTVPARGAMGSLARDLGIREARGQYLVFWDDDNLYEPHALATLFAAACEADIGVVQTRYRCRTRAGEITIPRQWSGQFVAGDVDTMCVCVRRNWPFRNRGSSDRTSEHRDRLGLAVTADAAAADGAVCARRNRVASLGSRLQTREIRHYSIGGGTFSPSLAFCLSIICSSVGSSIVSYGTLFCRSRKFGGACRSNDLSAGSAESSYRSLFSVGCVLADRPAYRRTVRAGRSSTGSPAGNRPNGSPGLCPTDAPDWPAGCCTA